MNITKLLTMAHHLRHKRKRRCPLLMKMHCNNVASKLSPARYLARSRSAIFWHWKQKDLLYPALPAEARRALDEGVICDMFEGHAPYKPRCTSYPITPVFWRTVPNGWSWKARKTLMTHSLCSPFFTTMYRRSHRCRSTWGNWMRCCNRINSNTRRDRYSNKTFLALPRQNPARCLYARQYRPV